MWLLWAFLAAICAAVVVIFTKEGLKDIDSSLAFAIQAVFIIIISWSVVSFQGNLPDLNKIDKKAWIFLICAGIATTLSTLFSFRALKLGQASYVTSVERLSIVFTIIFAVIILKEKLTWQLILGMLLMISGALVIALSGDKN